MKIQSAYVIKKGISKTCFFSYTKICERLNVDPQPCGLAFMASRDQRGSCNVFVYIQGQLICYVNWHINTIQKVIVTNLISPPSCSSPYFLN